MDEENQDIQDVEDSSESPLNATMNDVEDIGVVSKDVEIEERESYKLKKSLGM